MEIESKSFTSSMPVNFPSTYKATMCADISIKTYYSYFSGSLVNPDVVGSSCMEYERLGMWCASVE